MYIEPDTQVYLLKSCPLDKTYDHTIWFNTVDEQTNYFKSLVKYIAGNPASAMHMTYQRVNKGTIRVGIVADNLFDVNYIMFNNTSFGVSKWFYAFITEINYINNITSEIKYEIDPIQTWFFDYELEQCFVAREHSVTDIAGENLVHENLELGDYKYSYADGFYSLQQDPLEPEETVELVDGFPPLFKDYKIIVASTVDIDIQEVDYDTPYDLAVEYDDDGNLIGVSVATGRTIKLIKYEFYPVSGGMYAGVYSGLKYHVFDPADIGSGDVMKDVNYFLMCLTKDNKYDAIMGIFMIPSIFIKRVNEEYVWGTDINIEKLNNIDGLYYGSGENAIHNKKLFTAPFSGLFVSDNAGNGANYNYEYAENVALPNHLTLNVTGLMNTLPECMIYPVYYNGVFRNFNEKLNLKSFPQCAYNIDGYKAWVANNGITEVGGALSVVTGETLGTLVRGFNPAIGLGSSIAAIGQTLSAFKRASTLPPQAGGQMSGVLGQGTKTNGFTFYNYFVRKEFAKIIDNYFDCYGYQTNRVKVPNRNSRPHWNFVQTVGCKVKGSIPADDMQAICKLYDNGITFWKNPTEIGNYSLDNRPL